MKKAIYKPTNQNTIIISQTDGYCEILLDNDYKTVSVNDLSFEDEGLKLSTLDELKENVFINCIKNPLSDILYSYNTNRLTPEPHQYKPLIKFLNSENSRVLIADEVGLGKTIEAGMIFKEIDKREELKISLIVVPSSLTFKWKEELAIRFDEHFEIYKSSQFMNLIDKFDRYSSSHFFNEKVIISYHTLRDERVMKKIENSFFEVDFLIMDEAHTMRNYETSTFKSGQMITSRSEHILFLTATPVQNSLVDLFNILSLLDNDYFKDFDYFQKMIRPNSTIHKLIALIRNSYPIEEIQVFVEENINEEFPPELQEIFNDIATLQTLLSSQRVELIDRLTLADHLSFIINRTKKKDVGRSLPRNAISMSIALTQTEQAYYDAVIEFVKFLNPTTPQGFITIMPERMASSSMMASLESFKGIKKSGKLFIKDIDDLEEYHQDLAIEKEAMRFLDDIISKGMKIGKEDSKFLAFEKVIKELHAQKIQQMIVFSFFKKTLNYLETKLQSLGYSVGKIHGDFSIEERFAKIKAFKRGAFDILLSSEVGSEGLDMQFCNVVINYDLPWNPMRVEQRIGRIDRIGQRFDKLHIFNLCITGSIEDRIYSRLYTKLGIFENSIGELEPILGDFDKQLNISELLTLSDEEIAKKVDLEELALQRQKAEIKEQNSHIEQLINNDLNHKAKEESFLNSKKVTLLQEQSKKVFINFLNEQGIKFLELKDGSVKLSSEHIKQLFNHLKTNMSDKHKDALNYKKEQTVLQKLQRQSELKVSFTSNNNDKLETLYLYLNHPIISIITKDKKHKTLYGTLTHATYKNAYAIIYRVDFKGLKTKSMIRVLVLDEKFIKIDELDYFEFISLCSSTTIQPKINLESIKQKANAQIIQSVQKHKEKEIQTQNRLIDIKIDSISSYFEKQIAKTKRLKNKAQQEDILRMRVGEVSNLEMKREEKVAELMGMKEVFEGFEVLGVLEIGGKDE